MSELILDTPRWMLPMLQPARYKGAWGGRGSGKSHGVAEMVIEAHVMDQKRRTVCVREVQKSLNQSVKRLLETKIQSMNAGAYFDVQESCIKSVTGDGIILFQGMQNHTADSIKSLEGMDCAWVEEAILDQFLCSLVSSPKDQHNKKLPDSLFQAHVHVPK